MPTYVRILIYADSLGGPLWPKESLNLGNARRGGRRPQAARRVTGSTSFSEEEEGSTPPRFIIRPEFFIFAETIHCTAFCTPGAFVILQLACIHARTYCERSIRAGTKAIVATFERPTRSPTLRERIIENHSRERERERERKEKRH